MAIKKYEMTDREAINVLQEMGMTVSAVARDALIAVSPSLKESISQESAWAIFNDNNREGEVVDFICHIFESEKVSSTHFRKRIDAIVSETPMSEKGLIYTFFIPQDAPVHRAVYLSEPYGISIGDPLSKETVLDFYQQYQLGLVEDENSQLRFLPLTLNRENQYDLARIRSYRFTTLPLEQVEAFAQKIERVVEEIPKDHLEEMLELAALAADVEKLSDPTEKEKGYEQLCSRHLCRRDVQLALYYWHKIGDQNPIKFSCLSGIILCLFNQNRLSDALEYYDRYEERLTHKEQLVVRFAYYYLEQGNRTLFEVMLNRLPKSDERNLILMLAANQYPEYASQVDSTEIGAVPSDEEIINQFFTVQRADELETE